MLTLLFIDNLVLKGMLSKIFHDTLSLPFPVPIIVLMFAYLTVIFGLLNFGTRTRLIIGMETCIAACMLLEKHSQEYTRILFIYLCSMLLFLENSINAKSREFSFKCLCKAFIKYIHYMSNKANRAISYVEYVSGLKYPLSIFPTLAIVTITSLMLDILKQCIMFYLLG